MRNITIVTGTGRCGTTFLMKLFTCLGLNTGITEAEIKKNIFPNCNSGIEFDIKKTNFYIYKSPNFSRKLDTIVTEDVVVDFLIVPIRNFEDAAKSRNKHGTSFGGLCWSARDVEGQIRENHKSIATLVYQAVCLDVTPIFLHYEKMLIDKSYLYQKLLPLFSKFNISYEFFCEALESDLVKNTVLH